jgi:hypothetical protein
MERCFSRATPFNHFHDDEHDHHNDHHNDD